MAPREGEEPDGDFADNFDEKVKLLGYDSQNSSLVAHGSSAPQSLEDYLIRFRTSRWQKFLAKYIFTSVCLGFFRKAGHRGHMNWFLFWCRTCRKFVISYEHGFNKRLDCESCLSKSYP